MPCNSDHMAAQPLEVAGSKVMSLLDELSGKPINRSYWNGYHPMVYCKDFDKRDLDTLVRELCDRLKQVDVTDYSLEMQMWWRDHKLADEARERLEKQEQREAEERKKALNKLTKREKVLLGVDE